jgi:hypothetical protein
VLIVGAQDLCTINLQLGRTALMCAAERGKMDCVRVLVELGADIEAKDCVRAKYKIRFEFHGDGVMIAVFSYVHALDLGNSRELNCRIASRTQVS